MLRVPRHLLAVSPIKRKLSVKVRLTEAPPIAEPPDIGSYEATNFREVVAEILQVGSSGIKGMPILHAAQAVSFVRVLVMEHCLVVDDGHARACENWRRIQMQLIEESLVLHDFLPRVPL